LGAFASIFHDNDFAENSKEPCPKDSQIIGFCKEKYSSSFQLGNHLLHLQSLGYHTRKALAATLVYFCYKLGRFVSGEGITNLSAIVHVWRFKRTG